MGLANWQCPRFNKRPGQNPSLLTCIHPLPLWPASPRLAPEAISASCKGRCICGVGFPNRERSSGLDCYKWVGVCLSPPRTWAACRLFTVPSPPSPVPHYLPPSRDHLKTPQVNLTVAAGGCRPQSASPNPRTQAILEKGTRGDRKRNKGRQKASRPARQPCRALVKYNSGPVTGLSRL